MTSAQVMPLASYARVLLALLLLTGVTAGASTLHLAHGALAVALLIAAVKAGLVVSSFMHLRADSPTLRAVLALALFLAAVFLGLSWLDWAERDAGFERLPAQVSASAAARGAR